MCSCGHEQTEQHVEEECVRTSYIRQYFNVSTLENLLLEMTDFANVCTIIHNILTEFAESASCFMFRPVCVNVLVFYKYFLSRFIEIKVVEYFVDPMFGLYRRLSYRVYYVRVFIGVQDMFYVHCSTKCM